MTLKIADMLRKWFKYSKKRSIEEPTINLNGEFIKKDEFEKIWIAEYVYHEYGDNYSLGDSDYIDYHIWEDQNNDWLYKKYLPNTIVIRGKNPNIIFHGGCLGCISQRNHGIDRCKGCQYFRANWNNPNLFIEGEECSAINDEDDLKRLFGGK